MKQILIELPKAAYLPGEIVEGIVRLSIDKPVKARAVKLEIVGLEETHIEVRSGKHSHTYREYNHILKNDIILHGPLYDENLELQPGNYAFTFEFNIPETALPSYEGTNASVTYKLKAKVDVPFWLDIVDRKKIFVFRNRDALKLLLQPAQFQSENFFIPNHDKPGFSVELLKVGYLAGEVIKGSITLRNMGASKMRKVDVRLLGMEFAKAGGYDRDTTRHSSEIEISTNSVIEGVPIKFNLPTPRGAPSSYEGIFSNFRWAVEVGLDIPFGFDVKALYPVEILR